MFRSISATAILLVLCGVALGQTRSFTPVEGANLKAKIDSAITTGKANAPGGRFWVGYQFEVRPGVAIDFEIVDSAGGVYMSMDGTSMMFDARHETRELGVFLLYETQRELFTRAEVYNLRRTREFSNYPVYWAGRVSNEESLNYLKSIADSTAPEVNRLAERAMFAIALHDDPRAALRVTTTAMLLQLTSSALPNLKKISNCARVRSQAWAASQARRVWAHSQALSMATRRLSFRSRQ